MKTKKRLIKLFSGLAALAVAMFLAVPAQAAMIIASWEGTLDASKSDFHATDGYSDATLSYIIQQYDTGVVHYSYTFSDAGPKVKSLSHIIIEVSKNFEAANFWNVVGTTSYALGTYTSTSQGGSNPGLPNPDGIYGIKFNAGGTNPFTVSFDSNRLPVDGYFYFRDGTDGGQDVIAYNYGAPDNARWLLVPDTQAPPPSGVPLPPSALLLGSGLLGLGLLGFRRKIT